MAQPQVLKYLILFLKNIFFIKYLKYLFTGKKYLKYLLHWGGGQW